MQASQARARIQRWWAAMVAAKQRWSGEHFAVVVAGLAFRGTMVLFPTTLAAVSLAALLLEPSEVAAAINAALEPVPSEARAVVIQHAERMVMSGEAGLGLSLMIAVVVAVWSATYGMQALLRSYCLVYRLPQRHLQWRDHLVSVGLGAAFLLIGLLIIAVLTVLPSVVTWLGFGVADTWLTLASHWAAAILLLVGLEWILPWLATGFQPVRGRHFRFGSVLCVVVWVLGSW